MNKLLIIDDDTALCEAVSYHFSGKNWTILASHRGDEALRLCARHKIDIVLLDQRLPDTLGVLLCPAILSHNDQTKIIFITAFPNLENAVEAIRMGAYDYLSKPFKLDILELAITKAAKTLQLEKINQVQQYNKKKECEENRLIGFQKGARNFHNLIELAASSDAPLLLTGETGTGKSLIAKRIHCLGSKKDEAFISANCAAFPENLIEAELFGYEKGAFTGATSSKKGIFEMAEGGSLFLDEIGELPIHLQPKLLGVLDEKRIRRIGGENIRHVDARVIAATNINLEEAVSQKTFRNDLYYRLGIIRIHIPPLRERKADIVDLCEYFVQQMDLTNEIEFSQGEIERLMGYHWPGNVRELKNILERSYILRKSNRLEPSRLIMDDFPLMPAPRTELNPLALDECIPGLPDTKGLPPLHDIEKHYIQHILKLKNNNYSASAKALQISRSTLLRKLKSYDIR
jgi:DNA-binding NtrC family response regulator